MWFVLGLVSLTAIVFYRLNKKLHWSWGWMDSGPGYLKANGKHYKLNHTQAKNGIHTFQFGVLCPKEFHFRIKRETRWDRAAKAIGLSVEQCFSDPAFDEAFYVVSDNPALAKELADVPEFRSVIKALFGDKNLRKLTCEGQHLVAEYRVKSAASSPILYLGTAEIGVIVSALHEIADTLVFLRDSNAKNDPHIWKAAFLISLASGVLILGVIEVFRIAKLQRYDPLLESWPLLRDSALIAFIILAAWLISTAAWLRGSSHAHIVMGEVLISGGIGLLLCSYPLARDLNCEWDNASARTYQASILAKHHHHHSKSPDTYSFSINSAESNLLPASIEVGYRDYAKFNPGDSVELYIKPGLIGYPWVERLAGVRTW